MIRIEIEDTVASGNYTATAYQEGEVAAITSASHATRLTALANCLTALSTNVAGDLTKEPLTIVKPRPRNVV